MFPLVRLSSSQCVHPALQGAGGARELGLGPSCHRASGGGFALNKLPVGRAVALGAIKIVKLFPYPLSHSGAALLFPLLRHSGVHRSGRQRVLVSRVRVPGRPGESVVVHRQVSLFGGLPAQQDRHRDPASRPGPAEEQTAKESKQGENRNNRNESATKSLPDSVPDGHNLQGETDAPLYCLKLLIMLKCSAGLYMLQWSNLQLKTLSYFKVLLGLCS